MTGNVHSLQDSWQDMSYATSHVAAVGAIVALALVSSACQPRPEDALGGSVLVDGSKTVFPITEAVTEEFLTADEGVNRYVRVRLGASGTGGGFSRFCNGEIDITAASRPITAGEQELCDERGIEPLELGVAVDALAVVVNPQNDWVPGDCMTVDDLRRAWDEASPVRRWSDLDPDWPRNEIKFYSPGHDSGTFDYFTEVINGSRQRSRTAGVLFSVDQNVLVQGVMGDRGAFGYFGYAYFHENRDRLKALRIDGGHGCVEPSPRTVASGDYEPLSRPVFAYVRRASLQREEVQAFVEFLMDNVNELAMEVGYMPLPQDQFDEYRQRLDEALRT